MLVVELQFDRLTEFILVMVQVLAMAALHSFELPAGPGALVHTAGGVTVVGQVTPAAFASKQSSPGSSVALLMV